MKHLNLNLGTGDELNWSHCRSSGELHSGGSCRGRHRWSGVNCEVDASVWLWIEEKVKSDHNREVEKMKKKMETKMESSRVAGEV